jgi:hypothetical protein
VNAPAAGRIPAILLGIVLVGAAALVLVALWQPRATVLGYHAAVVSWTALAIGALPWLVLHELVGGKWSIAAHRTFAGIGGTVVPMAVLFVPVLLLLPAIYPWAGGMLPGEPLGPGLDAYLSPVGFAVRTVAGFAVFAALWALLAGPGRLRAAGRARSAAAAVGIILYGLAASFAGIDWGMTLDPHFASSVYGWVFMSHATLAALAVAIALTLAGSRPDETTLNQLAGLLLASLIWWVYIAFMQYLVVWSGDLPNGVEWYQRRAVGVWRAVIWIVGVAGAGLTFLALLPRALRTNRIWLAGVAWVIAGTQLLNMLWLLVPGYGHDEGGPALAVAVATALVGVGGLWAAAFRWAGRLEARPAPAAREEAIEHG